MLRLGTICRIVSGAYALVLARQSCCKKYVQRLARTVVYALGTMFPNGRGARNNSPNVGAGHRPNHFVRASTRKREENRIASRRLGRLVQDSEPR
jgi:hypothetical protein